MTTPRYSAVLVDLDGTIVDSAPGITSSIAATLAALGRPAPAPESLLPWVGPPIMDSFRDLAGFDAATSARALALYREHYLSAGGMFDAEVFPGVADALRAIHAAGIPLSLATSKPESTATLILKHFGLADVFDELTGASDDESRSSKADVVAEAMRRLHARGLDVSRPVLVGDRSHDVHGAAAHGIPTISVTWGYGDPTEWMGAVAVVSSADELLDVLGLSEVSAR